VRTRDVEAEAWRPSLKSVPAAQRRRSKSQMRSADRASGDREILPLYAPLTCSMSDRL